MGAGPVEPNLGMGWAMYGWGTTQSYRINRGQKFVGSSAMVRISLPIHLKDKPHTPKDNMLNL